jgi:multiple sugar transport system substrate-binding protein
VTERLRLALVGGPMYDHLYEALDPLEVEIVVQADHATLNADVARRIAEGDRLDLISTHSKYAPSQRRWLVPLDDLVDPVIVESLAQGAVSLCRFEGALLSLPRLIDVRILWARSDRVDTVPDTFAELVASGLKFGFPGRESGLFGTFFELVEGCGGRLFDCDGRWSADAKECVVAVEALCALADRVSGLDTWGYDDVDAALLDGRVDSAGAWPGAWTAIASSPLATVLSPHPYPTGPERRVSYAGVHSWAIPVTCGDTVASVELLERLSGASLQAVDAGGGSMCAHVSALSNFEPRNDVDSERLRLTREAISGTMITFPPLERWPEFEVTGWTIIQRALRKEISAELAVAAINSAAHRVLVDD